MEDEIRDGLLMYSMGVFSGVAATLKLLGKDSNIFKLIIIFLAFVCFYGPLIIADPLIKSYKWFQKLMNED